MLVIALTGGIGSGKSTVSEIFQSKNVPVIDTDIISRELVEQGKPAYTEIINTFGEKILAKNKSINRQTLRQIIFSSEKKRLQLENILHPLIWEEVKLRLSELSSPYCIVVVPLLLENSLQKKTVTFDRVLVIDAQEEIQKSRVQNRDNCDRAAVENIMASQVSRQTRLEAADDVLENVNNLASLKEKVELLHKKYLKLSK
ncbi:MAG: dephospho-CoA kinase [Gammaproteobacteria bacterium]|nr:dephospho-CoA kinase [Gammaproteobacteria bacterium]MCW8988293.1 dephospho-CoA kinase [Gammaproteobacteria bacterium]MCW9031314.1 dephospho-CoA kinase [Gammaproteobacteria bacterium]